VALPVAQRRHDADDRPVAGRPVATRAAARSPGANRSAEIPVGTEVMRAAGKPFSSISVRRSAMPVVTMWRVARV
jgi:hypothetical protein